MAKFLFLECEMGECRELLYGSCVAKEIASYIRGLGHEVVEVDKPSPSEANAAITRENPDVVWWIGHGNTTSTTLENVDLWIRSPDLNVQILNGKVACASSCSTSPLGQYLTDTMKCKSYMGYSDLYYFVWCEGSCGENYNCACQGRNPWGVREDIWLELVESPADATLHFLVGLAQGKNAADAYRHSVERFNTWIRRFEDIEPQSDAEGAVIAMTVWALRNNVQCQVLHGEGGWSVPTAGKRIMPLLAGIAAGGMLGFMTGNPVVGLATGGIVTGYLYKR